MIFQSLLKSRVLLLLTVASCVMATVGFGQEAEPIRINILQADAILRDRAQPDVQRLIGGVVLGMKESRLRCDSAWRFDDGTFRTMGQVVLVDGSQELRANEMELNPETQWVRASAWAGGEVEMLAEAGQLTCPLIRYQMQSKEAYLPMGGTLRDGNRYVEFDRGRYDVNGALLMLGGNVAMDAPDYALDSDSVHWFEASERFSFQGPSHMRTKDERFELLCSSGEYDVASESGWFGGDGRPGVQLRNDEMWLSADSVYLPPDSTLPSVAVGQVDLRDTVEQWTLSGHHAERLMRDSGRYDVWVAGHADLRAQWVEVGEADTLVMVADTFTMVNGNTTVWPEVQLRQSGSFATCDTLLWNTETNRIHLNTRPRMWMEGWLLQSDSLVWELKDNRPESLNAVGHASLVMPIDSGRCMQQVAGRDMLGQFVDGAISALWVNGNAESVYFDEASDTPCGEYNQSRCSKMRMDFEEGAIQNIALLDQPQGHWQSGADVSPVLEGLRWVDPPEVKR